MEDNYRIGWANSMGWLFERTDWKTYEILDEKFGFQKILANVVITKVAGLIDTFFDNIVWSEVPEPDNFLKEEFINDLRECLFPKGWLENLWDTEIIPNWSSLPETESVFARFFPQDVNDPAYSQLHVYQFGSTGHVLETFEGRDVPGTAQKKYNIKFRTIFDKRPYYINRMTSGTYIKVLIVPDRIANADPDGTFYHDIASENFLGIVEYLALFFEDALGEEIRISRSNNDSITLYEMELEGTKMFSKLEDYLTAINYIGARDYAMAYEPYDLNGSVIDVSSINGGGIHPETMQAIRNLLLSKFNRYPYDISAKYHPPVDSGSDDQEELVPPIPKP